MMEYTVGVRKGGRSKVLTVEGGDALMAALRVRREHPSAMITYVRRQTAAGIAATRIKICWCRGLDKSRLRACHICPPVSLV